MFLTKTIDNYSAIEEKKKHVNYFHKKNNPAKLCFPTKASDKQ